MTTVQSKHDITLNLHDDKRISLPVFVTKPVDTSTIMTHYPIFFFSGFMCYASWYSYYAERLAELGFVVVQYDVPFFKGVTDRDEVEFFPQLLEKVVQETGSLINPNRIGLAGHSRGGKIAALIYTHNQNMNIKALYLIDPVNGSKWVQESEDYPSAIKALSKLDKPAIMGITGAGNISSFNPENNNYKKFYEVCDQEKSSLQVLKNTGHMQFLQIPYLLRPLMNWMGNSGRGTNVEETMDAVLDKMIPWMNKLYEEN
eukprot:TRINITY_DN31620_c0_g1_i2.p1 TRINITY_DN31620_c0_g1~~TRINITY_DN31620_c0_g1_i2.p1  ORF type:complete len:285 (-),score=19.76 TRINITY_DN31620_c0_g1_i2:848-1621(-)